MPVESTHESSGRRYVLTAAKLTISGVLLAWLYSRVDARQIWTHARSASIPWLLVALCLYFVNVVASSWRWHLLLEAQDVAYSRKKLLGSFFVATFFNNFLPSNVGGDVIRIRDTARAAGSKTRATTVVLVDRGLGLMALVLVAALGATMASSLHGRGSTPVWPSWLWALFLLGAAVATPAMWAPEGLGRLLQPLTFVNPEWMGTRIDTLTSSLGRFRDRPGALASCFAGALLVQGILVFFYQAIVHALRIPINVWDLAAIVPISLVLQMLPISVNGFGVREATFSFYFTRLGLPIESAVLVSLVGAALTICCSLIGAAVYVSRRR